MVERRNTSDIATQLTQQLLDDKLMKRYGTSLNVNMGREYQKVLEKKYLRLKEEFDKINKNTDDFISIDELTDFINNLASEVIIVVKTLGRENIFKRIYREAIQSHRCRSK
jgi:hypothetical protein